MKGITQIEKRDWSRAKVLKTSKQRWDSLGVDLSTPKMYRHFKRMFLHQDKFEIVRFNCVENNEINNILVYLGIDFVIENNRFICDMGAWYQK